MKILLLSAYDANSHRYWWQQLENYFSEHDWIVLTLPARYFSWRIRGNSLTWAMGEQAKQLHADYQLIIATSMVDLSALRGMCPALAQIPTLLYFHENQFAYPLSAQIKNAQRAVEPMMVQLYAALSADRLCFNSEYNRQSFIGGVKALLKKLPDHVPGDIVQRLTDKSQILPVPIIVPVASAPVASLESAMLPGGVQADSKPPISERCHILWNHRWEYDKGPERLLAFIEGLAPSLSLSFHVVGQSFRTQPKVFEQIRQLLETRAWLGLWSYIESRDSYQQLLEQCHVVLSTALHDFQGLSILEGVFAGCTAKYLGARLFNE